MASALLKFSVAVLAITFWCAVAHVCTAEESSTSQLDRSLEMLRRIESSLRSVSQEPHCIWVKYVVKEFRSKELVRRNLEELDRQNAQAIARSKLGLGVELASAA